MVVDDVVVVVGWVVVVVDEVVVVVGWVVVVVDEVVVVVGWVVVVLDVVVVGGCVVVVEVVVVVVVAGTTDTVQPVAVAEIALPVVSNKERNVSPITASAGVEATTLNVTFATLTTPVGPVRFVFCNPEMRVDPLVNVLGAVVGLPMNSDVFPPATEAIVTTAGSYVNVIPYAPSGALPTSITSSVMN